MTRFARARGSKSSNKREPEEATSWSQLKEGLLKKPDNSVLLEKSQEIQKCKERLQELEKKDSTSLWSTFDESFLHGPNTIKNGVKTGVNVCDENKDISKKRKKLTEDAKEGIHIVKSFVPKKKKKIDKAIKTHEINYGNESMVNKKKKTNITEDTNCNDEKKKVTKKKEQKTQKIDNIEDKRNPTGPNGNIISKKKKEKLVASSEQNLISHTDLNQMNKELNLPDCETSTTKKKKRKNKPAKPLENVGIVTEYNILSDKSCTVGSNFPKSKKNKHKKEYKRKKPLPEPYQMDLNGEMVDIITYDGFPIMLKDAKRLDELKKSLYAKGIPNAEIKKIMKLQRRAAEKDLTRARKRVCFNCRRSGHPLSECPSLNQGEGTGICFKCGSTEHTHFECRVVKKQEYKFAQCFICKEQGHISNQCPDNPRGLYPKGGACKLCGDVTHLKRFCPTLPKESEPTIDNFLNVEDASSQKRISSKPNRKSNKIVQF